MIVEATNSKFYRVKELSDEYLSPFLWEGIELRRVGTIISLKN